MNYEDLYLQFQACDKALREQLKLQQKLCKSVCGSMKRGDLKGFAKDLSALEGVGREVERITSQMRALVENFDTKAYFTNGEYVAQLLAACEKAGVNLKGEYPTFELFPFKVKLDADTLDINIDRKKVQCFRPLSFVNFLRSAQNKLLKAPFTASVFAAELAEAYDLVLIQQSKGKAYITDADVYLLNLYKYLTPMKRFRKEYDQQSFAFDLSRLFSSGLETIDDGRSFQFGPSKNHSKAIRIVHADGKEEYFATIRFFHMQ